MLISVCNCIFLFVTCWRQVNITPILKDPPSSDVANYRPISTTSVLSKVFERLASGVGSMIYGTQIVCFQPPSLLIGKVWVLVMHYCVCHIDCKVYWRVGRKLGSNILISGQPLIGSNITEFSISSVLWELEVLCHLYCYSFYRIDQSMLWCTLVGVN